VEKLRGATAPLGHSLFNTAHPEPVEGLPFLANQLPSLKRACPEPVEGRDRRENYACSAPLKHPVCHCPLPLWERIKVRAIREGVKEKRG